MWDSLSLCMSGYSMLCEELKKTKKGDLCSSRGMVRKKRLVNKSVLNFTVSYLFYQQMWIGYVNYPTTIPRKLPDIPAVILHVRLFFPTIESASAYSSHPLLSHSIILDLLIRPRAIVGVYEKILWAVFFRTWKNALQARALVLLMLYHCTGNTVMERRVVASIVGGWRWRQ